MTTKALEGLKFSECLPPDLATRVLQRRMADIDAVRRVLAEPVQLVASMNSARVSPVAGEIESMPLLDVLSSDLAYATAMYTT